MIAAEPSPPKDGLGRKSDSQPLARCSSCGRGYLGRGSGWRDCSHKVYTNACAGRIHQGESCYPEGHYNNQVRATVLASIERAFRGECSGSPQEPESEYYHQFL